MVGPPAVQRAEPEHELLELERLGEVVVGAELEPGGLVVEPVGGGEHEDRHAAAGVHDVLGDLVAGRGGDVAVEDGDVVGVDDQQLHRGGAVTGDVGGDRLQAEAVADGLRQQGFVLDQQHAHAPMLGPAHIVGVSKTAYARATRPRSRWRRDLQATSTNRVLPDSDPVVPGRRSARRLHGDRRGARLPAAGVLVPRPRAHVRGAGAVRDGRRPTRTRASPTSTPICARPCAAR